MQQLRQRRRFARRRPLSAAAPLVTELIQQITAINAGMDANKDGKIGWQTGEGGLEQAQMHMGFMMKGEGL